MDYSLIPAAIESIRMAKDIGNSILSIRDGNMLSSEVVRMNDQLLKAQEALFSHNTQLLGLQQQLFETSEKLRKAEETIAERGRYTLIETGRGQWAYRVNIPPPVQSGASEPSLPQTPHYVCQSCFDNGRKVVLRLRKAMMGNEFYLACPVCNISVNISNITT